jgi:hypothetical protein
VGGIKLFYFILILIHPYMSLLYIYMCIYIWCGVSSLIFHTRRMCRDELAAYQLTTDLASTTTIQEIKDIVLKLKHYKDTG